MSLLRGFLVSPLLLIFTNLDFLAEFIAYLDYVQALGFNEDPDYERLKRLFSDCLTKERHQIDYCYDWVRSINQDHVTIGDTHKSFRL